MRSKLRVSIYYGGFIQNAGGAFLHSKVMKVNLDSLGHETRIITLNNLPILLRFLPHLAYRICLIFKPSKAFHLKGLVTSFLYRTIFDREEKATIFEDIYIPWKTSNSSIIILHAVWSDNLHSFCFNSSQLEKLKCLEEASIKNDGNIELPEAIVINKYQLKELAEETAKLEGQLGRTPREGIPE